MGNQISTIWKDSPLGYILQNWKFFGYHSLIPKHWIFLWNTAWPQYHLGNGENWPANGSLNYNTILQLGLLCQRQKKWGEIQKKNSLWGRSPMEKEGSSRYISPLPLLICITGKVMVKGWGKIQIRRIFETHDPTWADIQCFLNVPPPEKEKAMVFSKAGEEANKEKRNDSGHAMFRLGNQEVSDNKLNWDHWDNGEWSARQRLTHYKNMILKRIQAAGKKPVNWDKIRKINQEPKENPSQS